MPHILSFNIYSKRSCLPIHYVCLCLFLITPVHSETRLKKIYTDFKKSVFLLTVQLKNPRAPQSISPVRLLKVLQTEVSITPQCWILCAVGGEQVHVVSGPVGKNKTTMYFLPYCVIFLLSSGSPCVSPQLPSFPQQWVPPQLAAVLRSSAPLM